MVGENNGLVGPALKVDPPHFQALHNGEQLFVVDVVAAFVNIHLAGEVRTRFHRAVSLPLRQYAGYSFAGGVRFDDSGTGFIEVAQHWGIRERGLQFGKGRVLLCAPLPLSGSRY